MKHKYSNNHAKTDMNKTIDFYKAIDSVIIYNKDYRDIFDNAVQFEYNQSVNEYTEKDIHAIMVNNIRHKCSNYDQVLKQINKINRCNNDYAQYKNYVLNKIAENYPSLKDECDRQKRKFDMVKICNQR